MELARVRLCTVVILGIFLLILSWAPAGAAAASDKQKATASPLALKSFSVSGLTNESMLTALFRGAFEDVEINREDLLFEVLFRQYLEIYAQKCERYLPGNRVEMTKRRCKTEEVTENGFGVEVSRVCVHYVDESTGLWAKPELYQAKKEVDRLIAADSLRHVWRILALTQQPDPFASAMNMGSTAQAVANDVEDLFQLNGCTSPGLKRFEDNLRLFALNEQSIRLEGDTKPAMATAPGTALRDQDYVRLIEDLVADQAGTWAVNRYVSGSVRNVSISARDAAGRPLRMAASYSYDGFNGRSPGSVDVHFTDGSPDCMYFFDAPTSCRTPNRKIVAALTASAQTVPSTSVASPSASKVASPPIPTRPASEPAMVEPVAVPADQVTAPVPKRKLKAVNYIQGIKDACLEVLTGGGRVEPETSYCFCLSAAAGSIPVSDTDAQWLFENFSDEALSELERRYAGLVRRFASCRAQLDASR
jgi:hypothetical protein